MDRPNPSAPTTDQIRHAIDTGRAGDKVDVVDPAAAPLGTDQEAAGTAPSAAERRLAAETEFRGARPEPGKSLNPHGRGGAGVWIGVAIGVIVAIVIALLLSRALA